MFRREITGPRALAIFSSFFVVIIGVNLLLAWQAVATFPGLEVGNSYVASQSFEADRAAQQALGWTAAARIEGGRLILRLTGRDGAPVAPATLEVRLGRPTEARTDETPTLIRAGDDWVAPVTAGPGLWHLRLVATAADGTRFQQRLSLTGEGQP